MLVGTLWIASMATAHAQSDVPPPKPFPVIDQNGVSLEDGTLSIPIGTVAVGRPGDNGLSNHISFDTRGNYWRHSLMGMITRTPAGGPITSTTWFTVSALGQSNIFGRLASGQFILLEGQGGTLVSEPGGFVFTAPDGTVATFSSSVRDLQHYAPTFAGLTSVMRPSGERLTYHYSVQSSTTGQRLQAVTSTLGYQVHFHYADGVGGDGYRLVNVTAFNSGVDACDPLANVCNYSRAWPSVSFDQLGAQRTVTDALNRTTRFIMSDGRIVEIARPSMPNGQNATITWNTQNPSYPKVATYSDGNGTWTYDFPAPPPVEEVYNLTNTVTNPLGHTTQVEVNYYLPTGTLGQSQDNVFAVTNALGQRTAYGHDSEGRLVSITTPEGDRIEHGYSIEGNPLSWSHTSKPGSGLPLQSVVATYGDCSTPILCRRPTSVTDARGGVTHYTYDAAGNLLTETGPAPTPGAARPQTRYTWEQRYAWYKQSGSSAITQAPSPVWVQTGSSQCMTGATC